MKKLDMSWAEFVPGELLYLEEQLSVNLRVIPEFEGQILLNNGQLLDVNDSKAL